jgi:7-cyano-7-deazaguanine reductase
MTENQIEKHGTVAIRENKLEPIAFQYAEPPTLIYFTCPEGTSLCPRSGFPDFWTAHLWYVPAGHIVELKSLKLYINQFRDRSIYHEELAHVLLKDLREALTPRYLKVVLDYTRRGNIQTDVILEYRADGFRGPEAPIWPIRQGFR